MLKRLKAAGAVLLLVLAAAGLVRLRERMPAADVIRKLAGLRVAVTFYRMEYKTPPASFGQVLAAGKLETVPGLKLAWHPGSAKVTDVASFRFRDTGGWAYVNDPADPQFGLVYIDCTHRDEKGRFWSEL
ncbi:MAG: hypothetical protein WCK76_13160 [Elusimicrobiota bacterium]